MPPRIGLTCDYRLHRAPGGQLPRASLHAEYFDAILQSGGLPVLLPPCQDPTHVSQLLDNLDALVLTGGDDVRPARYHQQTHRHTRPMHPRRDRFEFELFAQADQRNQPILAICLGCQLVNVARGGTLHQHLYETDRSAPIDHGRPACHSLHSVSISPDSLLATIIRATTIEASSSHHQAIDHLGQGLRAVAFAPDGIVEAVEDANCRFLLAVQWHPEDLFHRPEHQALFRSLVHAARRNARPSAGLGRTASRPGDDAPLSPPSTSSQ